MLILKKSKLFVFSFILLFTCSINKQIKAQCHIDDWTALKALYENTGGDNWTQNRGWDAVTSSIPSANCNLELLNGVNLDEQGRVDFLNLYNNQLIGSIPAELGNLDSLEYLGLKDNQLNGSIPAELGNLSNLKYLELERNQLSDSIPAQLGKLSNLINLFLEDNQLSGGIPGELGNLPNLERMTFNYNQLSGSIPGELGNLSNLIYLDLDYNQLSGSIPAELGNLSNLLYLELQGNQLSGSIPAELGNLSNLGYLELEDNNLSGCYETNLKPLCAQLGYYNGVDEGNNFYAGWKDFCDNQAGICFENKPDCHSDDWFVLKDFYTRTNGVNWNANEGWEEVMGNKSTEACNLSTLYGISLDTGGRVSEINLSNNNLNGDITPVLAGLMNLKTLKIADNNLSGCYHFDLKQLCTQLTTNNEAVSDGNNLNATWGDFCLSGAGVCKKCNIEDWTALKALYESTNGNNWKYNRGWQMVMDSTPSANCNLKALFGVNLDEQRRVRVLNLRENKLKGSLPTKLGNLNKLKTLQLEGNQLSGNIPVQLGNLSNLESLYLVYNQLSGSIPAELGSLSNLESLYLEDNQLSGSIPAELGNLSSLVNLRLANNQLSGSIPAQLGNLSKLRYLNLTGNQLSGSIPAEMGNLNSVTHLSLENNNFSGCYDSNLSNLTVICSPYSPSFNSISEGNNFYASWEDFCENNAGICFENKPNCHSDDWYILKDFYDRTNGVNWEVNEGWEEITGNKSTSTCDLSTLHGISLDTDGRVSGINLPGNNLSGDITPVLVVLVNLKMLKISNNNLSGCYHPNLKQFCAQLSFNNEEISDGNNFDADWGDFCLSDAGVCNKCHIDDWTALKALYESTNGNNWIDNGGWQEVTGNTRSANCNLKALFGVRELNEQGRVTYIEMYNNQLSGSIPAELGNLSKLEYLGLGYNLLTSIPAELSNLSNLESIYLEGNQLSGNIPAELGNLSNLSGLYLGNNQLSGSIPAELGNLNNLVGLSLAKNQLSGSIPVELSNLSNLVSLSLEDNQLNGSIPTELSNLSKLQSLHLGFNQFSGNIPTQLGNLSKLEYLSMGGNKLSGSIPAELGNLSNLGTLSLGSNRLSGNIPAELGGLSNLSALYLGGNQLNGSIPAQLANLSNLGTLSLGNNQLSGNIPTELSNFSNLFVFHLFDNYFSCQEIENFISLDTTIEWLLYSPQYYTPENYDAIKINVFDTISPNQNLKLEIDFPFDITGFTYQWFRNGDSIPGATQATHNINTIQPDNVGKYTLHITNESCLPDLELISDPMYVILKGFDLLGQPVEYAQIMVQFDTPEETVKYEDEILTPNAGWVKKACNCNRELYLWQFPSTEAAVAALLEIDRKLRRVKGRSRAKGGFNNNISIGETDNKPIAYNILSDTYNKNYTDSTLIFLLDSGLDIMQDSFVLDKAPVDQCYNIESSIGYTYVDSIATITTDYSDELWHGTFGYHSITEYLIDKSALKIVPLKIFDKSGKGNLFDMACALNHAIDHNADVVNISAGYYGEPSEILESAINYAREKGIFITAAAGNDTINIDSVPQYPAYYAGQYNVFESVDQSGVVKFDSVKYDNVISVASINANDQLSQFSNTGKRSVTVACYGENINGYSVNDLAIVASGTSMSTFLATKALALEIAKDKGRDYKQVWNDFEDNWLVSNPTLTNVTQTGKQIDFIAKNITTHIEDPSTGFEMHPNPTNGMVQLAFLDNSTLPKQIFVVDFLGKSILSINSNDKIIELNLREYPVGVYFVRIDTDKETVIRKLILK